MKGAIATGTVTASPEVFTWILRIMTGCIMSRRVTLGAFARRIPLSHTYVIVPRHPPVRVPAGCLAGLVMANGVHTGEVGAAVILVRV